MRVSINSEALASAAGFIAKGVPTRSATPIYTGVVLNVTDDQVSISGQNPEALWFATTTVPTEKIESTGKVLLPGKLLSEIAAALPKGTVILEEFGSQVHITAGASRFKVPVMPLSDYTELGASTGEVIGAIPTVELLRAVDRVARTAANPDNPLAVLTGVRIEMAKDAITLAATDRYRLANATLKWKPSAPRDLNLIIPARQLADAVKALAKDGETISLSIGEGNLLTLRGATRVASIGSIDGDYPAWRSLLPKASTITTRAKVNVEALTAVLGRIALVAGGAPVQLVLDGEEVVVTAGDDDSGSAAGSDATTIELTGEAITVSFNPSYLKDALVAAGGDEVEISFIAPNKPALVTPVGETGYSYLVVPLRPNAVVAAPRAA